MKKTTTKTMATKKVTKTTTGRVTLAHNALKPAKVANRTTERKTSRKDAIVALSSRPNGATLAEIMTETGWQKHSVRGMISILGSKGGLAISSTKNAAGERTYSIAAAPKKVVAKKATPATKDPAAEATL
jgi:Protein of unknown function (DUF3489)